MHDGIPLLILDLETAPLPEAAQFLDPIPAPELQPVNRGLKDPAKIAADLEAKQAAYQAALAKWEQQKAEAPDACAVNPDLAQIVAAGYWYDDFGHVLTRAEDSEAHIIGRVSDLIGPATIVCGFSVRFDLATLMRRALYLGVPFPTFSLDKYRAGRLIDLQDILTFQNFLTTKGRSLDFYRQRFGLDVPPNPCGGEDIPRLYREGQWETIREHCRVDVLTTKALAERLGVVKPLAEAVGF